MKRSPLLLKLCDWQSDKGKRYGGGGHPVPVRKVRLWECYSEQHLKELVADGFVRGWGRGRNRHYEATPAGMTHAGRE